MNSLEIINQLNNTYTNFIEFINTLDEKEFVYSEFNAWTPGQQLDHLLKSIVPLNTFMALPNFMKKMLFGTNKSISLSYDEIVAEYVTYIKNGAKASKAYIPKEVLYREKANLIRTLNFELNRFIKSLEALDEKDFDKYKVPHPILGKLTLREMLYFTDYHAKHHLESIKEKMK